MRCPFISDLDLLALAVWREAGEGSFDDQLAVAWTWVNRAKRSGVGLAHEVLRVPQSTRNPNGLTLGEVDPDAGTWWSCYRAASAAYFALLPDPTDDASTRTQRAH